MKSLATDRLDLIDALVAEADIGGMTAGLLEKDEHLTDALRALFAIPVEGMHLVFCGGSSMAKAHGLIERMSEDADLKIVLAPDTQRLPRNQLRNRLSRLRCDVRASLEAIGLVEDKPKAKALNENRYFSSHWSFRKNHDSIAGLRPNLQIELTVRRPTLRCLPCRIDYLADRLAGKDGDGFEVATVQIAETVAEKVLSFLRRFAQHRAHPESMAWDTALVRHIYDVHCAYRNRGEMEVDAAEAFPALVAGDQQEFGRQLRPFADTPGLLLSNALAQAGTDARTQMEYDQNLLPLVYGNVKPPFSVAFARFESLASALIRTLPDC